MARTYLAGLVAVVGFGCSGEPTDASEDGQRTEDNVSPQDVGDAGISREGGDGAASPGSASGQLAISGHYLQNAGTGAPIFLMVDTAWLLFARGTREDIVSYLDTRKAQGFNAVMMTLDPRKNSYGDTAFKSRSDGKPDVTKINLTSGADPNDPAQYDYWDHARFAIASAEERGFYVIVAMGGAEFWDYNGVTSDAYVTSPSLAYQYGRHIASQFVEYKERLVFNVMDDRNVKYGSVDKRADYRALAEGLTDGINGENSSNGNATFATTLMTALPRKSDPSSSALFPSEAWIDVHSTQAWPRDGVTRVLADFAKTPVRPTWVLEGRYENYNATWNDWSQRYQAYTSTFAGALGAVYGESAVCIFDEGWEEKMTAPGATQMKHLVKLMGEWTDAEYIARVPDQSLLTTPGQVNTTTVGGDLQQATRTADGTVAMVYAMSGRSISVKMSQLAGTTMHAYWFNPRTGGWSKGGTEQSTRNDSISFATVPSGAGAPDKLFDPPGSAAAENDWVLVLRR